MNTNQKAWENSSIVADYKRFNVLSKPEKVILETIKKSTNNKSMLDIGIGAGRTTLYFAEIFEKYIGVDYSEKMVDACKDRFKNLKSAQFLCCDARNMSQFSDNSFDFVFFSFNGIDNVSHEDRMIILKEIYRVLKPNGIFYFSTHNLFNIPKLFKYKWGKNPVNWLKHYKNFLHFKEIHPSIEELMKQKYTFINNIAFNFCLNQYYVNPQEQIEQLVQTGFKNISVLSLKSGEKLALETKWNSVDDAWLYFGTEKL